MRYIKPSMKRVARTSPLLTTVSVKGDADSNDITILSKPNADTPDVW